jgi:hypothetical protein
MRYANGNLILDDAETQMLSMVTMKKIDTEYSAAEFIGSLAEMKGEVEKYVRETQAKQNGDKSDLLRIEVARQAIETFDWLAEEGYKAADAAGSTIKWQ